MKMRVIVNNSIYGFTMKVVANNKTVFTSGYSGGRFIYNGEKYYLSCPGDEIDTKEHLYKLMEVKEAK